MGRPLGGQGGTVRGREAARRARQALAVLGLAFVVAGTAHAARLGEVLRHSALYRPLDVELAAALDSGVDPEDVRVQIADSAVYAGLGRERDALLRDAVATIAERDDGTLVIRVTSSKPVREPILSLVIELVSHGSRVRRAYDLLFDPAPSASMQPPPRAVEQPLPKSGKGSKEKAKASDRSSRQAKAAPGADVAPLSDLASEAALAERASAPPPPPALAPMPRFRLAEKLAYVPAAGEMAAAGVTATGGSSAGAVPNIITAGSGSPDAGASAPAGGAMPAGGAVSPSPSGPASGGSVSATSAEAAGSPPAKNPGGFLASFARYGWIIAVLLAFLAWMRAREAVRRVLPARAEAPGTAPAPTGAAADPDATVRVGTVSAPRPASRRPEAEALTLATPHETSDFYDGMGRLLGQHLERDPSRTDLWLKLLEVSHADGNPAEFIENVESMIVHVGRSPKIWDHVVEMGSRLVPSHPMFAEAAAHVATGRRYYDALDAARLRQALEPIEAGRRRFLHDSGFAADLTDLLAEHTHRPTPLTYLRALSELTGGARIFAKREDAAPADAELQVIAFGQVLLAKALGRRSVVANSMDGRLGVAVAEAAAATGLQSLIYVSPDIYHRADHPANRAMSRAAAELVASDLTGADFQRLALSYAISHPLETMFVSGIQAGPPPYPALVRGFESVIGQEVRRQAKRTLGRDPDVVVTHARSGLAALGLMHPLLDVPNIRIECVEGSGAPDPRQPGALAREHSWLRALGRVTYRPVDDGLLDEARDTMGLLPDLDLDGHNVQILARAMAAARDLRSDQAVIAMFTPSAAATVPAVRPRRETELPDVMIDVDLLTDP